MLKLKLTMTLMDNSGAMFISSNLVTDKRYKHTDLRYCMIPEDVDKGLFKLEYESTDMSIADIMTKGIDKVKYMLFAKMLLQ